MTGSDDDNLIPFDPDSRRRVRPLDILDPLRWHDQPIPERPWLVEGLIPRRVVTMLGGDGGLGKSLLVQQLLTACATGKVWLDRETMPCRVLGVFCEDDSDELHRRQVNINQRYGVEHADLGDMSLSSRVGDDSTLLEWDKPWLTGRETPIYDQILNYCRDNGVQCLVLDSLHDVFAGDENKRPHARQFINALRDIAIACDAAVIVTAHPSLSGRASGTGEAGSTAWHNTVRSRLYLKNPPDEEDDDLRILATMKANYGRKGKEIRLKWMDGVFVNLDPPVSGTVAGIAKRNVDELFLSLLATCKEQGRHVSESPYARNFAPRQFARSPNRQGASKRELEFAMERLFADKRIRVETYDQRGRERSRIALVEDLFP